MMWPKGKGWPSGPQGGGTDADDHPLQGMVLHGCGDKVEAERWFEDSRRDWQEAAPRRRA